LKSTVSLKLGLAVKFAETVQDRATVTIEQK